MRCIIRHDSGRIDLAGQKVAASKSGERRGVGLVEVARRGGGRERGEGCETHDEQMQGESEETEGKEMLREKRKKGL
jgi:hypothetical protein